jgi:hypothetical protein
MIFIISLAVASSSQFIQSIIELGVIYSSKYKWILCKISKTQGWAVFPFF